jgi:hypothetical protein
MQITVQTRVGLFIIPDSKESDFIVWLQQNAIKAGNQAVYEQGQTISQSGYTGRQLISEDIGREF